MTLALMFLLGGINETKVPPNDLPHNPNLEWSTNDNLVINLIASLAFCSNILNRFSLISPSLSPDPKKSIRKAIIPFLTKACDALLINGQSFLVFVSPWNKITAGNFPLRLLGRFISPVILYFNDLNFTFLVLIFFY